MSGVINVSLLVSIKKNSVRIKLQILEHTALGGTKEYLAVLTGAALQSAAWDFRLGIFI